MTRIEKINGIIDVHIEFLEQKTEPMLNDTKTLTEILKAILTLEQIKSLEGKQSEFDGMSSDDLESRINEIGDDS